MGNRTRDIPARSAVPQPTVPPCITSVLGTVLKPLQILKRIFLTVYIPYIKTWDVIL
jgi:hypothetical protein